MMTLREARQRCRINGLTLRKWDGEYRVSPEELPFGSPKEEQAAYYTDDLEDAVLTGALMRRRLAA